MTGLVSIEQNLFSKQIINNSINNQIKKIDNSIKEIQQNIKAAKYENDKLSRKENLELIQLMVANALGRRAVSAVAILRVWRK